MNEGYVAIPNDILEALCKAGLSGREYQVMLAIIRKTIGWNKESDAIGRLQFEDLTGIKSKGFISHITDNLVAKRMLSKKSVWGKPTTYTVNKNIDQWLVTNVTGDSTAMDDNSVTGDSTVTHSTSTNVTHGTSTNVTGDNHKRQVQPSKTTSIPATEEVQSTDEPDLDSMTPIQLISLLYPGMKMDFYQKKYATWEQWIGEPQMIEWCKEAIRGGKGNGFVTAQVQAVIDSKNKPRIEVKQGGQSTAKRDVSDITEGIGDDLDDAAFERRYGVPRGALKINPELMQHVKAVEARRQAS